MYTFPLDDPESGGQILFPEAATAGPLKGNAKMN